MTMIARRAEHNKRAVIVQTTAGPVTVTCEEDASYLRHFWGELGNVLEQVEQEAANGPS